MAAGENLRSGIYLGVLEQLRDRRTPFDYPTRITKAYDDQYHLVENVPRGPLRAAIYTGRIAIYANTGGNATFTVYQPRWIEPLEEELAIAAPLLEGSSPTINTDFVEMWDVRFDHYRTAGRKPKPVSEIDIALSEARIYHALNPPEAPGREE